MIEQIAEITIAEGNNVLFFDDTVSVEYRSTISSPGNNVSASFYDILNTEKFYNLRPFLIGYNEIGDGSSYVDNCNVFIGDVFSDENGDFSEDYTIVLKSFNEPNSITIVFDKINKLYPHSITVDGVEYTDDDAVYTIPNLSGYSHTIVISNWNTANAPFILAGIYSGIKYLVDSSNMISLESEVTNMSEIERPSFGLVAGSGLLKFNDIDGDISDFISLRLLTSDQKIVISIKNTITGKTEKLGEYISDKWSYDNSNMSISVTLKDKVINSQNISVVDFYPNMGHLSQDPTYLYTELYSVSPSYMKNINIGNINSFFERFTVNNPYLYDDTLWGEWGKVCDAFLLHYYRNKDGKMYIMPEYEG